MSHRETKPVSERSEDRSPIARAVGHLHERDGNDHGEETDRVAPERCPDATHRNGHCCQRGADDPAEVPLRIRKTDSRDEVLARDQVGQRRLERGKGERADAAGDEAERCYSQGRCCAPAHPHRQDRRDDGRQRTAHDEEPASAPSVGHRRTDRAEHPVGEESGCTDERRQRCFASGVSDVVAQPDSLHPCTDVGEQGPDPHQPEISRSKWSE